MKKFLAIVLSIAVVFSCASVALAYEFPKDEEGNVVEGIWFGPEDYKVASNPGEDFTFTVELKSNLTEDKIEGYNKEGVIFIPFWINATDGAVTPIKSVELTEEAKAAGVRLSDEYKVYNGYTIDMIPTKEETDQNYYGTVVIPQSFLLGEGLDVLNVTATLAEGIEWKLDEYGDTTAIVDMSLYVGEYGIGYAAKLVDPEGNETYLNTLVETQSGGSTGIQVVAKYYEPTTKEKITEWWRSFAFNLLTMLNKFYDWLINDLFAPAAWNK